jgi:hypothetical protein
MMGSQWLAVQASPLERVANDDPNSHQPPGCNEAKGRGYCVERQLPGQPRKAKRKHEAESASRYPFEPRADAAQRRAVAAV